MIIKQYLKQLIEMTSNAQKDYYHYILKNGREYIYKGLYPPKPLGEVERKMCYKNAILSSITHNIEYVEGYYVTDVIDLPIKHAWNDIEGGYYDSTTEKFLIKTKERFGIVVPAESLMEWVILPENIQTMITPLEYYYKTEINKLKTTNYGK